MLNKLATQAKGANTSAIYVNRQTLTTSRIEQLNHRCCDCNHLLKRLPIILELTLQIVDVPEHELPYHLVNYLAFFVLHPKLDELGDKSQFVSALSFSAPPSLQMDHAIIIEMALNIMQ